jgi:hypothetical protein
LANFLKSNMLMLMIDYEVMIALHTQFLSCVALI